MTGESNNSNETAGSQEYSETEAADMIAALLDQSSDEDQEDEGEAEKEESKEVEDEEGTDEGESEEEETEEGDDEDTEDEKEDAPEAPEKPLPDDYKVTVKVDGEDVEVPLAELRNGYQRQSDYTRKTQALAEERKTIESSKGQYEQLVQALSQELNKDAAKFKDVNWKELAQDDPYQYNVMKAEYEEFQQKAQAVQQENQRIAKEKEQQSVQQKNEFIKAERQKLMDKLPEMKDSAKAKAFWSDMVEYASEVGLTTNELAQTFDHRVFLIFKDAMAYRKGKKAAETKLVSPKKSSPASVKPTPRSIPKQSKGKAAKQRFAESGSTEDAADLILNLI